MKPLFAFIKKEWMDMVRSGRLTILVILFTLIGIMNPAIAKMTPWMMEIMAESLEGTGLIITEVTVDALTSWTQFFKNVPIGMIAFVLINSSILTKEYRSGTLVMVLTKGLSRYKVILAKSAVMVLCWTVCYWLCYGITYGYNAYFWDNGIAENLLPAAFGFWLLGFWLIAMIVLFSACAGSGTGSLLGTGGTFVVCYLLGLFPKVKEYTPAILMNTASLLSGMEEPCIKAMCITAILTIAAICISIPVMNKRQI